MNDDILEYNDKEHLYTVNGVEVPSVTQVLGRVGVKINGNWRSITGAEFIGDNTAAMFGTATHAVIAHDILGNTEWDDETMREWTGVTHQYVDGYRMFRKKWAQLSTISCEFRYYHPEYRYAGTPDWFTMGEITGEYWLWDWKTGTQWQDHWWLQMAAYAKMLQHFHKIKKNINVGIVRLFEGGFEERIMSKKNEIDIKFNKFRSILNVYRMFV